MSDIALTPGATRAYHLDREPHPENGTALGFWLYLMSDCLIFAALFATYGVLGRSYAGGPGGAELFVIRMDGSHSGVIGLPLFETRALLKAAGLPLG